MFPFVNGIDNALSPALLYIPSAAKPSCKPINLSAPVPKNFKALSVIPPLSDNPL